MPEIALFCVKYTQRRAVTTGWEGTPGAAWLGVLMVMLIGHVTPPATLFHFPLYVSWIYSYCATCLLPAVIFCAYV